MTGAVWTLSGVRLVSGGVARIECDGAEVAAGTTAVVGPSGSGKTSLLNLLVGFERPSAGEVAFRAAPAGEGGGALPLFWSPQEGGLWPHLTARQHVEAVSPRRGGGRNAAALLDEFALARRADARPGEMSAGERSRLAVARALASEARVLVMDEPLSHVDRARLGGWWEVIRARVRETGATLVFSTHEPAVALREAARAIAVSGGRVIYSGGMRELYSRPASRDLAEVLGETNWLEPPEAALWLGLEPEPPRAGSFRPEEIDVSPEPEGPAEVLDSSPAGPVRESVLLHRGTGARRRFLHRPPERPLVKGLAVSVRALACVAAALAPACSTKDGPALPVKQVGYVNVPAERATVPAPRAVAVRPDGRMVVLDTAGRVLVMERTGEVVSRALMPETAAGNPEGVCVFADGSMAIADTHYGRVVVMDAGLRPVRSWGALGRGRGEFIYPVGVAWDGGSHVYVSEYGGNDRVQKFTLDGRFVLAFGAQGTGRGEFQRASGLAVMDGRVYVADAMNNRIQVFTDSGELVGALGEGRPGGPPSLHYPYDIEPADGGALFVMEYGAGRVTALSPAGEVLGRFGRTGRGPREMFTPWGLAVAADGAVLVADTGNRRIVELVR